MINALVISNNINFVQTLINELNINNFNIKISNIITDYSNVMELVNSSDFRVIFVDNSVPKAYAKSLFKTYKDMIILLSYDPAVKLIAPRNLRLLDKIIAYNDLDKAKEMVSQELLKLGYNLKYKGTNYLIEAITYLFIHKNRMLDTLKSDVYPIIGKKYGKTANNIKSSINKATECMYCECNSQVLQEYFGFYIDTKPTVKTVIFTVLSKLSVLLP